MTVSKEELLTSFIKYWAGMDLFDQDEKGYMRAVTTSNEKMIND